MIEFLACAWAASLVLAGVEEVIRPLGKWRGLLGLTVSGLSVYVLITTDPFKVTVYTLAATFIGLVSTLVVESTLTTSMNRAANPRTLPRRVPPL